MIAFLVSLALTIWAPRIFGQINLGSIPIGEHATIPVTITFNSSDTIGQIAVVTQGSSGLDFRDEGGGSCKVGVTYSAKSTCTVNVRFKPQYSGTRNGAIIVTDNRPTHHEIATIYLEGAGQGPQAIFSPGELRYLDAEYYYVTGVVPDAAGNFFVADSGTFMWMGTIPGSVFKESLANGKLVRTKIGSGWKVPWGVAIDGRGSIYVSDVWNAAVYKETPTLDGEFDQTSVASGFETPVGIAVDGVGNVYVADFGYQFDHGTVYKETLEKGKYVRTVIGDGWIRPYGIAVDGVGNVYVADFGTYSKWGGVYKETLHGERYVKTEVGSGWFNPNAIAVDGAGNLYVADIGQFAVLRESLVNGEYVQSVVKETITNNGVYWPYGVGLDGNRTVYVADAYTDMVSRWSYTDPPSFAFENTRIDTRSEDSPKTATVLNVGDMPLSISEVEYPQNFHDDRSGAQDCTSGMLLDPGGDCTLKIDFVPRANLGSDSSITLDQSVSITSNSLNHADSVRKISVRGVEVKSFPRAEAPVITPHGGTFSGTIHVRITDSTPRATIYFTLDGSTPTQKSIRYYSWETLSLTATTTLRAIAIAPEHAQSIVSSVTFKKSDFELPRSISPHE